MERRTSLLQAALLQDIARPSVEPVSLVSALIRACGPQIGVRLIDRCREAWAGASIARLVQSAGWRADAGSPPPPLVERMVAAARGLTEIEERVPSFCALAAWIHEDERRQAFERFKDSSYPRTDYARAKPVWRGDSLNALLRASPDAWKEEWIADHLTRTSTRPAWTAEAMERDTIGHWPQDATRRLWVAAWTGPRAPNTALIFLIGHLPGDLRELTLERLRREAPAPMRSYFFAYFRAGLTDDEVDELVRTPWVVARGSPLAKEASAIARHLESMQDHGHLGRARRARVDAWFEWARSSAEGYWQDRALEALLPCLAPTQLRQAIATILSNEMKGIGDRAASFADRLTADEIERLSVLQVARHLLPRAVDRHTPWPGLLAAARRCSRELWEQCLERFAGHAVQSGVDERLRVAAALVDDMEARTPGFAQALAEALLGGH